MTGARSDCRRHPRDGITLEGNLFFGNTLLDEAERLEAGQALSVRYPLTLVDLFRTGAAINEVAPTSVGRPCNGGDLPAEEILRRRRSRCAEGDVRLPARKVQRIVSAREAVGLGGKPLVTPGLVVKYECRAFSAAFAPDGSTLRRA